MRHAAAPKCRDSSRFVALTRFATLMSRDQFSDLRAAYAKVNNLSVRTAQRHSDPKSPHPDWQRFIGLSAAEAVKQQKKEGAMTTVGAQALGAVSPFQPSVMPTFYDVPDEELHPMQLLEKRAWELHSKAFDRWKQLMVQISDSAMAALYARDLPKMRQDFEQARQKREAWEVEQRMLVTLQEFQSFQAKFLSPLAEMLKNIPTELAALVNPDNPDYARAQFHHWLTDKAEPRIRQMLEASGDLCAA